MESTRIYDVIVIGSGAGGGAVLHRLAPSGKRVLVLERGGYLPREKDNWSSRAVFIDNKYKAPERWLNGGGKPFKPEIHYYVGGQTKLYGAALLRFHPKDFEELPHREGMSPAWPISYADMAPYYAEAERLYRVRGLRHEPRIEQLEAGLRNLGCHPFPLPVGVMLDEDDRRASPCVRCDTCDGYPCLLGAKADAETVCVTPALRYPNVTLLTHTRVTRLQPDASGREVAAVLAERDGAIEAFRGGIVVAACGAINSAALLLASGIANRSGQVGRNYMCHNNSAYVAISPEVNETRFQKTLAMNDFYLGADDWPYPLGHIQTMGKADAEKFAAAAPLPAPYGALERVARHSLDFWLTSEDLPDPNNRVLLERGGAIRLQYRPNNLEAHDRLNARLTSLLHRIDRRRYGLPLSLCLRKKIPMRGVTHQCGTLRFGRDPRNSVLDPDCKAHDLDNLYVVDGSFFPSSAAMNPALTIIANALRVSDRLIERLR